MFKNSSSVSFECLSASRFGVFERYYFASLPKQEVLLFPDILFLRDAQGNVLAVYDNNNTNRVVRQSELHLYGSSRLGLFKPNGNRAAVATNGIYTRRLGRKEYELTDHLGNVRTVIGDYRQTDGANPVRAALRSYFNHYAFGLEMPGMVWKGGGYRYGYNGKEQDADFANNYDYGFRIYNPGVAKFLSVDPLSSSYPMLTPYQFASNNPIMGIDQDGLEFAWAQELWDKTTSGYNTAVKVIDETYTRASPYVNAAGRGLKSTANNLAPYRPLTPEESKQIDDDGGSMGSLKKWPGRTWDGMTSLPGNLKKVYAEGTAEQQIETTVGLVGTIAGMAKGKAKIPVTGRVLAGFNPKTRIVTYLNRIKQEKMEALLPEGFEKIVVGGEKADVFKQKGKKVFITPDLDGHTGGIWKMATGKAENLFKKETREGTYNADLSVKIGE